MFDPANAVDIHLALVIPAIEGNPYCMGHHPCPLPLEYSLGCILCDISNVLAPYTKYLHFLKFLHATSIPNLDREYSHRMDTGFGRQQP